jgi:exodeoxyribonuclease VII small subunit
MKESKQNIEQSLQRLEKIVEELNARDVDVEEGLTKFKEGVELIKVCRGRLGEAKNEFKKLQAELEITENAAYTGEEV